MQSDRSSTIQSDRRRLSHYVSRLLLHGMARLLAGARAADLPLGARRDRDSHTMRGDWFLLLTQVISCLNRLFKNRKRYVVFNNKLH